MRAILMTGAVILSCVALSGCDKIMGTGTTQQAEDCHCLRQAAPQPEHLTRLAPPGYPQYAEVRHRYRVRHAHYAYREHRAYHAYESIAQGETFQERSYYSASGTYIDAETGYGSGRAYGMRSYREHGWRRAQQGRGYWIDGYGRAHYISRNAELAAANASNMAVNSQMDHRTWFGYDKDCPEGFGQDGY
jgi:hypothetical protein